ncbi:solute carrier family 28 member 3-like [Haemaphysalis longicornis]
MMPALLSAHDGHLLTANLLTANLMTTIGGLAMAKLLLPETKKASLASAAPKPLLSSENTVFEAGSNGVTAALPVVMHILVTVIVYTAFLALLDALLQSLLLAIGYTVNLREVVGTLFLPLTYAMGLSGGDAVSVGYLLAMRTFGTEVLAFIELNKMDHKKSISHRSVVVATYGLCSSGSLGQLPAVAGVFTNVAPRRSSDIQGLRWRALFTGCLSACLNACIAGCLVRE